MKLLANYTIEELTHLLDDAPLYRAKQIFKWVSVGAKYQDMTNLPKDLRERLSKNYSDCAVKIVKEVKSEDGSVKMLYKLWDGNIIEGIYISNAYGNTLCVSTQVGCRMKCAFCASGTGGLVRHLLAGEIYGQVIAANKRFSTGERAIANIVLMGSGEPLDNYQATTKFINLVCHENGLNFSQRGISLSTCGLPDEIRRLADDGFSITLSISLHATDDDTRAQLMPIAKKYKIHQIMDAARYYFAKSGRRVAIEYIAIKDKNISYFDAKRLKEAVKGLSSHINIIPLNYVKESQLLPASDLMINKFEGWLKDLGLSVSIRRSAGKKSYGACGQLRNSFTKRKQ